MRGKTCAAEERGTVPYMKKTPADHAGGIMAVGSSVRIKSTIKSEKNEIFSEFF